MVSRSALLLHAHLLAVTFGDHYYDNEKYESYDSDYYDQYDGYYESYQNDNYNIKYDSNILFVSHSLLTVIIIITNFHLLFDILQICIH